MKSGIHNATIESFTLKTSLNLKIMQRVWKRYPLTIRILLSDLLGRLENAPESRCSRPSSITVALKPFRALAKIAADFLDLNVGIA